MCTRRTKISVAAALALMLAIGLLGCASQAPGGSGGGIPIEAPYIIGEITAIQNGRVLIEATPGQQTGNKSWLAVSASTRLFKQDGKLVVKITASDLAVGQEVSAWVSGPVLESYPTQGGVDALLVH